MKRFVLSLTLVAMGAIAFLPVAHAASEDSSTSATSSLTQIIQQNRDMRNKN